VKRWFFINNNVNKINFLLSTLVIIFLIQLVLWFDVSLLLFFIFCLLMWILYLFKDYVFLIKYKLFRLLTIFNDKQILDWKYVFQLKYFLKFFYLNSFHILKVIISNFINIIFFGFKKMFIKCVDIFINFFENNDIYNNYVYFLKFTYFTDIIQYFITVLDFIRNYFCNKKKLVRIFFLLFFFFVIN
jgi:hypothetical protein